mmetsp:Transcript_69740/g.153831  ORF Transcript_69740/g.153831 Transcript_69740/m.153831 type:complete len:376 (+) Transcript_69740:454-1581(+)
MEVGSPPCSPQMPRSMSGLVARPRSTAVRTSSPTPSTSIESNGSRARMPLCTYCVRNLACASSRLMPNVICVRSLVPKLKNSATDASLPACSAPRGTSIMVPIWYGILTPLAASTRSAAARRMATWFSSSSRTPTRGTISLGCTLPPALITLAAASMIALACIWVMAGCTMPRRQPRRPIMGLDSLRPSRREWTISGVLPSSVAICWHRLVSAGPSCGRNSCSGGSSMRTVTGRPSMARKMPSKSSRWYCSSSLSASAAAGDSSSTAAIMRRTAAMRCGVLKNMCSVRVRPMPWAPLARATLASSGVSALVHTCRRRLASTQPMNSARSPAISGSLTGCLPLMISPVVPLRLTQSPSLKLIVLPSLASTNTCLFL